MSKTLAFSLVLLAANIASAAAAPQIPSQYHGEWCAISQLSPPPKEKWVSKRCRDRYVSDRGGMQVHGRWYDSLESRCTVTKVTVLRAGHQVQAKCKHETGEEWSEHWSFFADRLITVSGTVSE